MELTEVRKQAGEIPANMQAFARCLLATLCLVASNETKK